MGPGSSHGLAVLPLSLLGVSSRVSVSALRRRCGWRAGSAAVEAKAGPVLESWGSRPGAQG